MAPEPVTQRRRYYKETAQHTMEAAGLQGVCRRSEELQKRTYQGLCAPMLQTHVGLTTCMARLVGEILRLVFNEHGLRDEDPV